MSRETESDSRSDSTDPTKSTDQLAKSIRREVVKLSDKWSGLLTGLEIWQRKLDDALPVSEVVQFSSQGDRQRELSHVKSNIEIQMRFLPGILKVPLHKFK